jgi:2-phospho-L-lactate guanylyltransferase
MTDWAVIPVKPLDAGKTRLATTLSTDERLDLNRSFLKRTLRVALSVFPAGRIIVVSRCAEARAMAEASGACAHREENTGLNAALEAGAHLARAAGAERVLSLSTDLPLLQPADLKAMLDTRPGVAIARDRRGSGTNALLQAPGTLHYAYGNDSFAAHARAAETAQQALTIIDRPGLRFDIDTPEDWRHWRTCRETTGSVTSNMTVIR